MGIFLCWGKLKILLQDELRQKIRIQKIYNMAYFIAVLSIYFDLSRGKFRLVYINCVRFCLLSRYLDTGLKSTIHAV